MFMIDAIMIGPYMYGMDCGIEMAVTRRQAP